VKVPVAERLRWLMGLAGLGFWFTGFWALSKESDARWAQHCPSSNLPECSYDYLPVLEMVFAPIIVLLFAYPIARFTFTMWAPAPEARTMQWWPASRRAGGNLLWPFGHLLAAAGVAFSIWRLVRYPLTAPFLPFYLYWGASALWCVLAIWIAWPRRERDAA
jgi:hypothetical protein